MLKERRGHPRPATRLSPPRAVAEPVVPEPTVTLVQSLPLLASDTRTRQPFDERGDARVLERATAASEARKAKLSGRAVNGGHGGPQ